MKLIAFAAALLTSAALSAQQTPTPAAAAWWAHTTALANDSMEGRDTGTEAYERAARYVAEQFRKSGLQPAGENHTFFQRVPMHEIDLDSTQSAVTILHPRGEDTELRFPLDVTTVPRSAVSIPQAPLVFVGYGLPPAGSDLQGKIAVFFNNTPAGLTAQERDAYPAQRLSALTHAGAVAIISIDNPSAIEPFHWPAAYARSVTLTGTPIPTGGPPVIRMNPAVLDSVLRADAPSDLTASHLIQAGGRGEPLPTFPIGLSARIRLSITQKDISSPNVLALFPGVDPSLAPQVVAVSAHLDGYGFGTPVAGDTLYNGALDDAAYVATLIELADNLHRAGNRALLKASITPEVDDPGALTIGTPAQASSAGLPRRSVLFAIFTGEEKGLLGSAWFTQHPTLEASRLVADLNLDQLRPIFPLRILTMEGLADSTLGETARTVASGFGIQLRPDHEPERNLFRRADNFNFVRIGVPIASFIFGYDPGTPEERTYREWYAHRYHKPQDDLGTPIDWAAAVKFNQFFRALTLQVANVPDRPQWLPTSPYSTGASR